MKDFSKLGITFDKLKLTQINEAADLIHYTYQNEGIWLAYKKEDAIEELMCSFSNLVYKPTYFVALHNNKIIGLASYMWSHCSSNVYELSFGTVHPGWQRMGIGQELTRLRLKEIIEVNNESLITTVSRRPTLFEKFNFKTVCSIQNEHEESAYMICKSEDLIID
jgi:N-acetylglutamate synthase-like GNAT family acetyltransferase